MLVLAFEVNNHAYRCDAQPLRLFVRQKGVSVFDSMGKTAKSSRRGTVSPVATPKRRRTVLDKHDKQHRKSPGSSKRGKKDDVEQRQTKKRYGSSGHSKVARCSCCSMLSSEKAWKKHQLCKAR